MNRFDNGDVISDGDSFGVVIGIDESAYQWSGGSGNGQVVVWLLPGKSKLRHNYNSLATNFTPTKDLSKGFYIVGNLYEPLVEVAKEHGWKCN